MIPDIREGEAVTEYVARKRAERRAVVEALPPALQDELELLVVLAVWREEISHSRGCEILGCYTGELREKIAYWRTAWPLLTDEEEAELERCNARLEEGNESDSQG